MWRLSLGGNEYLSLAPAWSGWNPAGQGVVLVLSLAALVLLIVWLARWDRVLVSPRRSRVLLGIRLLVALIAWSLAALQPTLVTERDEDTLSRVLIAIDSSGSMDIADPQRDAAETQALAKVLRVDRSQLATLTRKEITRRLLTDEGVGLESALAKSHALEVVTFRDWAESVAVPIEDSLFKSIAKRGDGTNLSAPLQASLLRGDSAGGKLIGIVLLSDGQHHGSGDPLAIARELAPRNIPIFATPIGSKTPPADIAIIDLKAPKQAAKDAEVVVEAKIRLRGIPPGKLTLRLTAPGASKDTQLEKTIDHDGKDATIAVPFPMRFEAIGVHRVEVSAESPKGTQEVSSENNRLAANIRVASDKTHVLLIDADMRWEHHYLAAALQRDPDVAMERVVFHAPRLGSASDEKLEAAGYAKRSLPKLEPNREDPLWAFDLIVLGDVAPEDLTLADRRRLETYVGERGGTLVVQAGKRWQPLEFLAGPDDPLRKLIPIEAPQVIRPKDGFRVRLSDAGEGAPFLRMDDSEPEHRKVWAELPKHFWAVAGKPKAGAMVLGTAEFEGIKSKEAPAIIVQSNFGFGKVLYLGFDSTWRWRYRVGDKHHHRFWGQLARWAGADPWTPGGNRLVRFGAVSPVVRPGDDAEAIVRIAESMPLPSGPVRMNVVRIGNKQKEELVGAFELPADGKRTRQWQGKLKGLPPGEYRLEPNMAEWKDAIGTDQGSDRRDVFTVQPPEDRETADLATNFALLAALAEASGGRVVPIEEIDRLPSMLRRLVTTQHERIERRPWQDKTWSCHLFLLLIGLLSIEWAGRKWAGLP